MIHFSPMKHLKHRFSAVRAAALAAAALCGATALAAEMPIPGSAGTGAMGYATDAFPGFDPDSWKVEQKKPSWWFSVDSSSKTPEDQWKFVRARIAAGEWNKARKACEALVRAWPETLEAAFAQETIANLYVTRLDDIYEAFDEYDYLLKFYPGLCKYEAVVSIQYRLAECMYEEQKAKGRFSFSWTGPDTIRRKYEKVVRYAPGAAHVPDAMMRIAELRTESGDDAQAVLAYEDVRNRFPGTKQASDALYLEAAAMMELVRKNKHNRARRRNAANYLKQSLQKFPDHPKAAQMREWMDSLNAALEDEAWAETRFYDTRQRSRNAAISSYEVFIEQFPESPRAQEARERIKAIKNGAEPLRK